MIKKIVITGLVFAFGSGLYACKMCHHRGYGLKEGYIFKKIARKLDLDEEQKRKLEAIQSELREKRRKLHKEHESMIEPLIKEVKKDAVDKKIVDDFFKKRESAHVEMREFMVDKFIQFHKELSKEQKNQLAKLLEKLHRWKRHGK